ncbi:MAG: hypothetical protein HFH35_10580 [Eubacterium sp.]|nr:hypothetical protein [Eubacterium sp.]
MQYSITEYIDTDEYKRRTQKHIEKISFSNKKMDHLINGILELVAEFEQENLKDHIRLAFELIRGLCYINRYKRGSNRLQSSRPPVAVKPTFTGQVTNA